jgi:eukaryotic-like serine/threonine-protein kinase
MSFPAREWQWAKALFQEALELPEAERPAFLAARCAGKAELRAEIEALLAAHGETDGDGLLEPAAPAGRRWGTDAHATGPHADEDGGWRLGERLGPWQLVRVLGSGGMGTVYLAERADGVFVKQAAVKVVKRGMDTDAILSRFRAERQILAELDHPDVCRLLDGGVTADGLPYFVMEHVDGVPIDIYCRERRLPVPARLALVARVCDAVHAANQRLVVHRDIKPRNILVAADGSPKLLDFGIAKLLLPGSQLTDSDACVMTPEYASPEQVRGEPVTSATDVHALGLLLHELLVGRTPFAQGPDGRTRGRLELAQAILAESPAPPSRAVGRQPRLARALRGDLDNIVAMALRKDPSRRYASAALLAADLRRHLAGEPILARGDSPGYRLAKLMGRHPVALIVASALAITMIVGPLVDPAPPAMIRRQRAIAERRVDHVLRVINTLVPDPADVIPDPRPPAPPPRRLPPRRPHRLVPAPAPADAAEDR